MNKRIVLKAINSLPANFLIDELFEKLILIEKIEEGIKNANEGNLYSTKEAKEKIRH